MVRKVTISLPDELAEKIDREAEAVGISRSELVQEASAHYIAHSTDERVRSELRRRRQQALDAMAEIGSRGPVRDPRGSLEIIKEGRHFQGAPAWDSPERAEWESRVGYAQWRKEMGFDDDLGV